MHDSVSKPQILLSINIETPLLVIKQLLLLIILLLLHRCLRTLCFFTQSEESQVRNSHESGAESEVLERSF